ncbi:MAG: arginine--tRNA ligase [Planctomycetota bacterium]|nr:arginine--tRNA ligase [Planctomycetota bacterium]
MNPFREEAVRLISQHAGIEPPDVDSALTTPPKLQLGDFAFPCFALAKERKQKPNLLAQELAGKLGPELDRLGEARAVGPYVNLFVDRRRFADVVLREAIRQGVEVGRSTDGDGKVVAMDYSSPNIAKPFHVGHLRSTIIGGALYRLFETLGYRPLGINHLGDWGTQFGKQIVGLKRWGKPEDLRDLSALNRLYVKYHQEEAKNPELAEEARGWFRKQEEGDSEALRLWQGIRETSLEYFQRVYERLGVHFDHYLGESFYNDKMDAVIELAEARRIAKISEGALVIDLTAQGIETPALLRKADGATLYLTRDLAAAMYRKRTYAFHKLLYVVSSAQNLHFQQLFTCLKLLGEEWAEDCFHVNFGLIHGMSTRKGNVIYLEELLDEARERALRKMAETAEHRPELEDKEAVAEAVGLAAIFFSDLSKLRIKDYQFNWDTAISFEGDTGPYLINAHARIAGIVRKCGVELDPDADLSPLEEAEAHQLVSLVSRYGETLREAAALYEPSVLAGYLLELARALHGSYSKLRVKGEAEKVARARLLLFTVVKNVLANGLRILGIAPLERM